MKVLLFALCLGFTALVTADSSGPFQPSMEAVVGVLASLGVWWGHRWPIGFAVFVGVLSIVSVSASGVTFVALFIVALHRRIAVAVSVAIGYAVASLLSFLARPGLPTPSTAQVLLGFVCVAAVLAWGMFIRTRRQLAHTRVERAAAEQEQRIAQARQSERDRIAREMHDVLGHRLSLLSLHAGALELWPDSSPEEISRAAGVIRESARLAMEDLREVVRAEAIYRPQPALSSLTALVDESAQAGMQVALDFQVEQLESVPEATGRTAYRIVQEGLTNARKHAPSAEVSVAVQGNPGIGLTVEIRNPTPTCNADSAGSGLVGLTERAELAGGRLQHGRTDDGDFRLQAWLPWPR